MKVGFISLGCAKNLVDSELILGTLQNAGIEIVSNPEMADAIIINTCGFIEPAKEEAISTIMEMKEYHKKLIVCGCYAQRYKEKLLAEMPFIDRVITLNDYPRIHLILAEVFAEYGLKFYPLRYENRMLTGSIYSPYVKISEGCDNHCTYCAIPLIRGKFRSIPEADILEECKILVHNGAKEINLISQDTSRYGTDLPGNGLLEDLIRKISQIEGVFLVRVLYLYPDEITDGLLNEMATNPKVAKYFDIPIQHISTSLLQKMNRRQGETFLRTLLQKMRTLIPEAIIRTTLIVGFPGETEADFDLLETFVKEFEFDRMGVFSYSREEDTPAYHMPGQIDEAIKQDRYDRIMQIQKRIALRRNKLQIRKIHSTLIEAYDPETKFYYGRSYAFAPDDIDGYIVFQSQKDHAIGDIVDVKISTTIMYDLLGDAVF